MKITIEIEDTGDFITCRKFLFPLLSYGLAKEEEEEDENRCKCIYPPGSLCRRCGKRL